MMTDRTKTEVKEVAMRMLRIVVFVQQSKLCRIVLFMFILIPPVYVTSSLCLIVQRVVGEKARDEDEYIDFFFWL